MAEGSSHEESDYESNGESSGSYLNLSCEFSSFKECSSGSEEDNAATVEPYQYEPQDSPSSSRTDSSERASEEESATEERLLNDEWCTCGHCTVMPSSRECVCCAEIDEVAEKMQEGPHGITCIAEHEGFKAVCLNVWVLQTAYFQYRQHFGDDAREKPIHERCRFTAYRQLTGWCWGWLGKKVRVVLPSCAVTKIRTSFPSDSYTGFKYPHTNTC